MESGPAPLEIQDLVVVTTDELIYKHQGSGLAFSYNASGQHGISSDPQNENEDKYRLPIKDPTVASSQNQASDDMEPFVKPADPNRRFYRDAEKLETENQKERILATVKQLLERAQEMHQEIPVEKRGNTITRVVTNEFMFFTKEPLSCDEFEEILNGIAALTANEQNTNILLTLASFAVLSPRPEFDINIGAQPPRKLMNVTPHIQCGEAPQFDLMVKHKKAYADPTYKMPLSQGEEFKNMDCVYVDSDLDQELIANHILTVNNKFIECSFENVVQCQTKAGTTFYSCTDICLDHKMGKAKSSLTKKLTGQSEPVYCSHVLTSNTFPAMAENIIGEVLTHADPRAPIIKGRINPDPQKNVRAHLIDNLCEKKTQNIEVPFGPPTLKMIITPPVPCAQFTVGPLAPTYSATDFYRFPRLESKKEQAFDLSALSPPIKPITPHFQARLQQSHQAQQSQAKTLVGNDSSPVDSKGNKSTLTDPTNTLTKFKKK